MEAFHNKFTVFYDAECPICSREVHWLQRKDNAKVLQFISIDSPECRAAVPELSTEELSRVIYGKTSAGALLSRVDVFREIYSLMGYRKLVSFSRLWGIRSLLDVSYAVFAKLRVPLGRVFDVCTGGSCRR